MAIDDEKIMADLRDANCPAYCWKETLENVGQAELSRWIGEGEYIDDGTGKMENTFFYPATPADAPYARLVTNLVVKELVLIGDEAFTLPLSMLVKYLDKGLPETPQRLVENAMTVMLTGFMDTGAAYPLTPFLGAKAREFVLHRIYKTDQSLILFADKHPLECNEWWPQNFLHEVEAACTVIKLTTPPKSDKVVSIRRKSKG